jgi:hypothetical protein
MASSVLLLQELRGIALQLCALGARSTRFGCDIKRSARCLIVQLVGEPIELSIV